VHVGLCITINSTGLGSVAVKRLVNNKLYSLHFNSRSTVARSVYGGANERSSNIAPSIEENTVARAADFMLFRYCAEYEVIDAKPGCQSPSSAAPWTRTLIKGAAACVECQSVAMRRRLGNRCRGHGVLGRLTRWNAATAPGCSGRWKMTSARRQCRCNPDSQLSFIFI